MIIVSTPFLFLFFKRLTRPLNNSDSHTSHYCCVVKEVSFSSSLLLLLCNQKMGKGDEQDYSPTHKEIKRTDYYFSCTTIHNEQ